MWSPDGLVLLEDLIAELSWTVNYGDDLASHNAQTSLHSIVMYMLKRTEGLPATSAR